MSSTGSIADITQLGFTNAEILILEQQTALLASRSTGGQSRGNMTEPRGRGQSRHGSQPSSRNASVASSGSFRGRVALDSVQMGRLDESLENMCNAIGQRIAQLDERVNRSVENQKKGVFDSRAAMEAEKKRLKAYIEQMDELDDKCEEIQNLRRKLKIVRERVDRAGGRLDNVSIQRLAARLRE